MDYKTFKRHLGKAGLGIGDYARIVDMKANAVSNYSKKPEVPHAHALLAVSFGEIVDRGGDLLGMLARHGALPASYFNDPERSSVIQLEMFRELKSGCDSKKKTSSHKRNGSEPK